MSVVAKWGRYLLAGLFVAAALLFAAPFAGHQAEGNEAALVSGFLLMAGDDGVQVGEDVLDGEALMLPEGGVRPDDSHFFALIMLLAVIGLFAALFGRNAVKRCWACMLCALCALALGAWMALRVDADFLVAAEVGSLAVASWPGWGLYAALMLLAGALVLAALGVAAGKREAADEAVSSQKRLSMLSRVAVLGAISAVLYYFEVPIIPPIYKLDLSAVPALIAGFAMGPMQALGVMLVKDLIGLLHTSSMGVGELADFIMSGSMAAVASLVYLRRHTLRGALLGLIMGILAMAAAGALANYFIMIPFYVQVMSMPLEVILSLIANTVPAVDTLPKLILLAVVPFNLLKGVVLAVVTLPIYKRIAPMLKNL